MQLSARHIIRMMLITTMLCVLASCASDPSEDDVNVGNASDAASAFISLTFTAAGNATTRANPTGGEDGDGTREHGHLYESRITDAVAFFYQDDGGVNGSASTSVTPIYFDQLTLSSVNNTANGYIDRTYTTSTEEINVDFGTYKVLVVANPGSDAWWEAEGLTLGDVRERVEQTAWTESEGLYSYFVMSSEEDAEITITERSTIFNPASTEVNVERLAARVDYRTETESLTCTDESYEGATVEITGACLVNNLTAGSYLFKRVAETTSADATQVYLGDETANTDGAGTNYVIDPWTAYKTTANLSGTPFTIDGESGKAAADLYGLWWGDSQKDDPAWWATKAGTTTMVTDDDDVEWQRIGYTLENTTSAANSDSLYNTAVVFKAQFNPVGVSNYTTGSTFFAYGTHIFASMEDMMEYACSESVSSFDAKIDACTTWDDVQTFINSMLANDPSGYKYFLEGEIAGKTSTATLTDEEKAALKWEAYMLAECGYSATLADGVYTVTLDQGGLRTYEILAQYGTRTYKNATCYYTWWIRHANNNDDSTNGIMEFAIVRNCIYKLTVSSVYSLGGYVPGDESLVLDVYVKDWTLLDEEVMNM